MARFYLDNHASEGASLCLSQDQGHHLKKVLRAQVGEEIELFDGKGWVAKARVSSLELPVTVEVLETSFSQWDSPVHLCFGLPKGAALDFIFRRCTEIGVGGFQPLFTRYSQRTTNFNRQRWEKVTQEVAKQCERNRLPSLGEPLPLSLWLEQHSQDYSLVLCSENKRQAQCNFQFEKPVAVLVGSEGGWSDEEEQEMLSFGAQYLGLGNLRLRTETACLVSCSQIIHQSPL